MAATQIGEQKADGIIIRASVWNTEPKACLVSIIQDNDVVQVVSVESLDRLIERLNKARAMITAKE